MRGCKGGRRRLEKRLRGNVWRVQPHSRAVQGGQKRLARLPITPERASTRLEGAPGGEGCRKRLFGSDFSKTLHQALLWVDW